jgi:type I restriction enzyme R subunit
LKSKNNKGSVASERDILNLLNTEVTLRSKRELIERFISDNLPKSISDADDITTEFGNFWEKEKQIAFDKMVKEESLSSERTEKLIEDYLFAERTPMRDEVLELIEGEKPSLLQRKKSGDRISCNGSMDFVETFIDGMMG